MWSELVANSTGPELELRSAAPIFPVLSNAQLLMA